MTNAVHERRLNEALATLRPSPPTESLRRRVLEMAPGRRALDPVRTALAASLFAALATVASLGVTGEAPVAYLEEITPDTLPLVDELAASDAEPEQVAALPLD